MMSPLPIVTMFVVTAALLHGTDYRAITFRLPPGQTVPVDIPNLNVVNRIDDCFHADASDAAIAELTARGFTCDSLPQQLQASGYPAFEDIEADLQTWAQQFPNLCRLYQIGTSTLARPILVMQITDNPLVEEFEPEFKYVANMHGDEAIGQEMAMQFIEHLLTSYGTDLGVTALVDGTDIHVLPIMNPDGYVAHERNNATDKYGYDLNRNFPSPTHPAGNELQPETVAVMDWTAARNFVLSASLHSGAVGIVYPWGHAHDHLNAAEMFPETPLARELCFAYTALNPTMAAVNTGGWENGIINGLAWYPADGEMTDWNYRFHGCIETTIELSVIKAPDYGTIENFWTGADHNNRAAMLEYARLVHGGVRGFVTSAVSAEPLSATVHLGISGDGPVAVSLPLNAGWNLASLPVTPVSATTSDVFPDASDVLAYDAATNSYVNPDTIVAGVAYWVHYAAATTRTVYGTPATSDALPLDAGWNLIGSHGYGFLPVDEALAPVLFAVVRDDQTGALSYQRLATDVELQPFAGYWVYASVATQAFIGATAATNPPLPVWSDRGNTPHTGDYHRLLAPGRYDTFFRDITTPVIEYTGAAQIDTPAGQPFAIEVTVPVLHGTLQQYGVDVASGDDANGLPDHTRLDVELPVLPTTCRLYWQPVGDANWHIETLPQDQPERMATIRAHDDGVEVEYRFFLDSPIDTNLAVALPADGSTFIVRFASASAGRNSVSTEDAAPGRQNDFSVPGSTLLSADYLDVNRQ